jgi:hypothetical protein
MNFAEYLQKVQKRERHLTIGSSIKGSQKSIQEGHTRIMVLLSLSDHKRSSET